MRNAAAVVVALFMISPACAAPVTLSCDTKGDYTQRFGRLVVVVDLERLLVAVKAPDVYPNNRWEYQNGRTGPLLVQGSFGRMDGTPVVQFVRLTASSLEMGYRDLDGELLHMAHIDRAALNGGRCRWRTSDDFDLS